jgi:hypothetical protein
MARTSSGLRTVVVGALGPDGVDAAAEVLAEDLLIQKEEGAEGLVLGGGGDVVHDGEVAQEGFDFGNAHVLGMTLVMKQNVTSYPLNIGFFCTIGVVFEPN